jgi:hypothetical protein
LVDRCDGLLLFLDSSGELVRNSSAGLLLLRESSAQLRLLHRCTGLVLLLPNSSFVLRVVWVFVKAIHNLHADK